MMPKLRTGKIPMNLNSNIRVQVLQEKDELYLLCTLVESYEMKHYPIAPPDPIDAIKFRMEQMGMTKADMVKYLGSQSRVSEILNGKRRLTLKMVKSLYKGLKIPAEILLA